MKQLRVILGVLVLSLTAAWAVEEGIRMGPMRVSIWGEISGTYDDNVRLVVPEGEIQDRSIFEGNDPDSDENQEEDIYLEGTIGVRAYRQTDSFLGSLSGMYTARRYDDFDDLDNESFDIEGELRFGDREDDRLSAGVKAAYREVFDYEKAAYADDFTNPDTQDDLFLAEDRTERVTRQLTDVAGLLTWRVSDKLNADFSAAYGLIEYDTELLFDWEDVKGQIELDYRLSEKTSALLTGQYGQQESDSIDNQPDYYVIRGGLLNRTTDKLTFKGGVGLGRYDRFRKAADEDEDLDVEQEIADEGDDVIDYVSFDLAGDWDLNQRTKLQFIARNAVQPAAQYTENSKLVTVASLGLSRRILDKFRLSGTVSYRNDDYEDLVEVDTDVFVDQEDTIWGGQVRLDYEPPNGHLNLYAEAKYEDRDTTLPNEDYDQIRLTLGLKVKI